MSLAKRKAPTEVGVWSSHHPKVGTFEGADNDHTTQLAFQFPGPRGGCLRVLTRRGGARLMENLLHHVEIIIKELAGYIARGGLVHECTARPAVHIRVSHPDSSQLPLFNKVEDFSVSQDL